MLLDHQLAQQIVDRTMLIIGNNINVMNHAGTIIASGDNDRIGKIHDGALLALKHGDTLEVNHGDTPTLKGVKPGINLLLKVSQQVIGVVGITGDPNSIRSYAELVKMTAEMIVEQAKLIEQLQWDRRHKEEFITAWVQNKLSKTELEDWSSRLEIDLSVPRVAAIIRFERSVVPVSQETIRKVVELLEYPQGDDLVAVLSFNEMVILKPYQVDNARDVNEQDQQILEQLFQRLRHLLQNLQHKGIGNVNIALGKYFKGAENIAISFKSAQQVMAFGQLHQPNKNLFLFDEVRLPVLLSPLTDTWQGTQLSAPYSQLLAADKSGQLVKTLQALFTHQGNLKACAESLFIHRNTLRYRLNKIEKITNTSPHEFSGLVELYLAHMLSS
ncbi:sugar diacid recognition domain-containing protein [Vibrio sp. TH_r3]|uniref:sugar diacid recognition domain-containing protein n=1 Tax=Vibrio sp. TH_r3 TaxID=3082084 RepID=UPI002952D3CD|nr:sugar diacid recognition domain-containing protein [Vibrio sp. TH_r3]MDV7104729.1 sugar diacid recognition domain-containing protein [Vibrio sp. TH_r3]